jgi:hypothetical protein
MSSNRYKDYTDNMSNRNISKAVYTAVPGGPPPDDEAVTVSQLDLTLVEKLPAYDGYHHFGLVDFGSKWF